MSGSFRIRGGGGILIRGGKLAVEKPGRSIGPYKKKCPACLQWKFPRLFSKGDGTRCNLCTTRNIPHKTREEIMRIEHRNEVV